jgi:hypothetical protein
VALAPQAPQEETTMLELLFSFLLALFAVAPTDQITISPSPDGAWVGASCRHDGTPIPPRC